MKPPRSPPGTATARCGFSRTTPNDGRSCLSAPSRGHRSRTCRRTRPWTRSWTSCRDCGSRPARHSGRLADEAAWWARYLSETWHAAGEPFERRLLDAALEALAWLPGSQGEQLLLHQDLHADNVLRAGRQPWLAIDPKPLVGERAFGIAAIVRGDELGRGPDRVRHRLDRLTAALGLDRERARLWPFAQTLAWAVDEDTNEVSV